MYIERDISPLITELAASYPIIVITGPRQTGKTTLCRHLFPNYTYYNLEDIAVKDTIENDPKAFLANLTNNVIIDEVQNLPSLLSYLQVYVDTHIDRQFVITGSSDFSLMKNITQSLAGRAAHFTVLPFSFKEISNYVDETTTDKLIVNGFYPGVLVKNIKPWHYYDNYYTTYIQRDLRQIKAIENLSAFNLFVKLLAGRAGTEINYSSLAVETGVTAPTIKSWVSILETSYIVFHLHPYYRNLDKRLTKTPKIYFYDTGILCRLLGIRNEEHLETHPLRGAIFENLAVAEMIKEKYNHGNMFDMYFYRENKGREVDIIIDEASKLRLYEIKSGKTFNKSFLKNLTYLRELLGEDVKSSCLIYDGETILPTAINIRQMNI